MFATVNTAAVVGLEGRVVEVQVDIGHQGLPTFLIVGLPGGAVREARERVRTAIKNSGLQFPLRRITVNLAPAEMPKSRLFELRIYESHSARANRKKIEMFNSGEIDIFRKTGLRPVFFGEAIAGARLPNLTYLLVFDDMAARERHWAEFVAHPDWKELSAKPEYANAAILRRISSVFLRSGPGSDL